MVRFLDGGAAGAAPSVGNTAPRAGLRRAGPFQTPVLDRLTSQGADFDRIPASPDITQQAEHGNFPQISAPDFGVSRETSPEQTVVEPAGRGLRRVGLPTARDLAAEQQSYAALPWTERTGAQLKSGVETLKQSAVGTLAKAGGTLLTTMDRIDRGEAVPETDDPAGYQHMALADRQSLRSQTLAGMARNVGRIVDSDAAQRALPRNPAADALVQRANAGDWSGAWQAFSSDPAGILQQFSVESLPLALPGLAAGAAGAAAGGVPGFLLGLAGGSYPTEYGLAVVDLLRERGVDLQDSRGVETALSDPAFLAEAGRRGNVRGTAIAAFDAAGGRLAAPLRAGGGLRNVGVAARNVGTETASEMAGEAAAQIGADGEVKAGDILAEGLGALPQSAGTTIGRTIAASTPAETAPTAQRVEPFFGTQPPQSLPAVDLPPVPETYPFRESGIPEGAQPAEAFIGPDPRVTDAAPAAPEAPPMPSVADILDDDRPLDEIKAEQDAALNPPPPEPEATRSNPVVVQTPEDLDRAALRTNQAPTPAQAEAGNYAKAVIDWNGLKINIETPRGGERVAKDGSWTVPDFPAHYGEIRRTEGADGDPVDVYIGPEVAAPSVFVIDQIDPQTGRFDEHKVMLGFSAPESALDVYGRAFSDGSAQSRIGAIKPMTLQQFRNWLKNGDATAPVAYVPKPSLPPAKRRASLGRPMDMVEFIAANGGLRDPDGELRAMDAHRTIVPKLGNLYRKAGLEPDQMREALEEAGYLPPGSTPATMYDLLRQGIAARKAQDFRRRGWSERDAGWVVENEGEALRQAEDRRYQELVAEIRSLVEGNGGKLVPEEADRIAELVAAGEEIEEAIYIVITSGAIDADAVAAKVEEQVNDGADTPFPEAEPAGADAQRGEGQEADADGARGAARQPERETAEPQPAKGDTAGTGAADRQPERSGEDPGAEGQASEAGVEAASADDRDENGNAKYVKPDIGPALSVAQVADHLVQSWEPVDEKLIADLKAVIKQRPEILEEVTDGSRWEIRLGGHYLDLSKYGFDDNSGRPPRVYIGYAGDYTQASATLSAFRKAIAGVIKAAKAGEKPLYRREIYGSSDNRVQADADRLEELAEKYDFDTTYPQPLQDRIDALQIEGRSTPFDEAGSRAEQVKALTDEHLREVMSLEVDLRTLKDAKSKGVHPTTGKTPKGKAQIEAVQKIDDEIARVTRDIEDALAVYEEIFGSDAAALLDMEARRRVTEMLADRNRPTFGDPLAAPFTLPSPAGDVEVLVESQFAPDRYRAIYGEPGAIVGVRFSGAVKGGRNGVIIKGEITPETLRAVAEDVLAAVAQAQPALAAERKQAAVTERTEQGEQAVIPGAERVSDRTVAERRMEGRKKPTKPQKQADEGLFDTGARKQQTMFDRQRQRRGRAIPLNSADGVTADEIRISEDAKGYVRLAPDYIAKREALARDVGAIITRMTGRRDMNAVVVDRLLGKVETTGEWIEVAGLVDPVSRLLVMAMDAPDALGTARHESIHLLRAFDVITPAEWQILAKAAETEGWLEKYRIEQTYPDLEADKQLEEAVAAEFGIGDTAAGRPDAVRAIFRKIAEFLRRVRAAYRRLMGKDPDWRDIFSAIETGSMAAEESPLAQPVEAMAARRRPMHQRKLGLPPEAQPALSAYRNMQPLKSHADYRAAKAGDGDAAIRFVRDMVPAELIETAQLRFPAGTRFAPVVAEEFTGDNQIPAAMAGLFAAATDGQADTRVVQVNRAFHTGAGPMERLLARSLFAGEVEPGASYVIVDDVTTMGGTLADMASHIRQGGGQVIGVITLVNASREGVLLPKRQAIREIERRYGDAIRSLFQIEPESLTADEARYILNFRDADGLRSRADSAKVERDGRLRAKGVSESEAEAQGDASSVADTGGDLPLLDPKDPKTKPLFNRLIEREPTQAARKEGMLWGLTRGYPVDRVLRMPFEWFGGMDEAGNWKPGLRLSDAAGRIITEAKFDKDGPFAWLNPTLEGARAGLIDRYGLDPEYVARDRERRLDERRVATEGRELIQRIAEQVQSPEEWRVLHAVLTGEDIGDADWQQLAEPVREAIDQLSQEAVQLGLLSPESYERNRGTYLHRVYTKYENDKSSLARWAGQQLTSRRRRVLGDQYRGRGIFLDVDMDRLMEDVPGYAGGMAKPADIKSGFRLLEKTGQGDLLGDDGRPVVEDRVWWPVDRDVPARFSAYEDRGTWEVRDVRGDKATLWRDYTKAERERMGEITDARYTIAKTFLGMAHDLSVGRFYRDIARNEGWARKDPPPQRWVEASEYNRFWNDPDVEWVRVPETVIPDSGGKLRWGALSGRFVRAEIWRDINEIEALNKTSLWSEFLRQWKQNKTARNPVVHMNNVMSNFVLMDMADVRITDFGSAARSYLKRDGLWKLASDNGAFGADIVSAEMRREILEPVLAEIEKQNRVDVEKVDGFMGKAQAVLLKLARALEPIKKADRKMREAYQLEDEVFRLALFKRRLDQGFTPKAAADEAREQFIDYDIRAPWINALRRSVLPFISYTYRAAPIIARTVASKPWKLAKYFAIAYGLNALAYAMLGDDADEDKERGSLRENERGSTWIGVPRLLRLPLNRDDNPVFLDIRRWIPGADVFDLGQGQSAVPVPAPLMPGGPIAMAAEIFLNKKAFDGKEIVNKKTDTLWDQAEKIGDYAWKSLAPSAPWVPGSWYWEKIDLAAKGARDRAGNEYSVSEAVLQSAGIKVGARDVDFGYAMQFKELDAIGRELNFQAGSLRKDYGQGKLSEQAFRDAMQSITEKRRRLAERRAEINRTRAGQ